MGAVVIERDAQAIGHRSPYKRIDLGRRRRELPRTITRAEVECKEKPDPDLYWRDPKGDWHLIEDQ